VRLPATLLLGVFCAAFAQDGKQQETALHAKRAQEALKTNQSEVAVRELTQLLRLDPANANAHANLGVIAFTRSEYEEAVGAFGAALKIQPSLWSAQALLGICKIRLGDGKEGRSLLERSLPHLEDVRLRAQAGLELIQSYSESGDLEKAVPVLQALRRANPADAQTLYTAFRTYSDLAAAALQSLAKVAPDSGRIYQVLAQNFMSQENYGAAIAEYRKALQIDPRLAGGHFELGQAILARSASDEARVEAEKEFLAELELNARDANSSYELGEIAYQRSDFETALHWYSRAVELRPQFVEARVAMGKVLAAEGRPETALGHLSEAVRLAPENKVAHYRLAQVYRQLGRFADAEAERQAFERLSSPGRLAGEHFEQVERRSVHAQTIEPER
jgi:tetratricopeptide (TPR) repeat protein